MSSPWPSAVVVTLLTIVLVGAIAVVATPAGCRLGLHVAASPCASQTVANATPSTGQAPQPLPTTSPQTTPSSAAVATPSPTHDPALPPYMYPASGVEPPDFPYASAPLPAGLALNCRLPIYAGSPGSGGFLVFPDRSFIADPRSAVAVPSPNPPLSPGSAGNAGNFYGLTYDKAFDRWLPVPWRWVAPDGKRYVFPTNDGIYVVDVTSGAQSVLGQGRSWSVLDVGANGVYAGVPNAPGLWLLPFSGAPAQISTVGFWQGVAGDYAYGTATSQVPQGVANTIIRLDLRTNATLPFFAAADGQSDLVGFDGGSNPIFQSNGPAGTSMRWVPASGEAQIIASNGSVNPPVTGDAHGVWLMNAQLIYLFVPGTGTYEVALAGGQLAGTCA